MSKLDRPWQILVYIRSINAVLKHRYPGRIPKILPDPFIAAGPSEESWPSVTSDITGSFDFGFDSSFSDFKHAGVRLHAGPFVFLL